ncbi:MAG: nucleotidyltransferase family protein [Acidovorax sp.]|nr:nucleotidyltransferase family protein [Acidovorax sp.]
MPLTLPTVLILASGRGERFKASGGAVHKLQALLAGKPVLQHTLDAVRASGLPWHVEDAGHPGMGDSIAAAVRHTAHSTDAAGWLVLPGDLPLVQPATLQAMAQVLLDQRAVVAWPEFAGERGHPVAFGRDCLEGLLALSGEKGAAPVVRHWAQQGRGLAVPVRDEGVAADIDTVQALERAEALWAKTQARPAQRGAGEG